MTLERAKQLAKKWANGYVCSLREGEAEEYHKLCFSALRAQEENPFVGWISVKDKLPEAGGYVVCIAKRNPFSRFMPMVARIEKNGWVNPITEQYISEVTHWMPLPCPPKEE